MTIEGLEAILKNVETALNCLIEEAKENKTKVRRLEQLVKLLIKEAALDQNKAC